MPNDDSQQIPPAGKTLIQQGSLRKKLGGSSPMWIHRHQHELPVPIKIGGRRFWIESEIDAWIAVRAADRSR